MPRVVPRNSTSPPSYTLVPRGRMQATFPKVFFFFTCRYPYFYTSGRYMYVSASQLTLRYLDYLTYTLPSLFMMMMMIMMSGAALSDTASIMLCTVSTIRAIKTLILSPAAHAYLCIGQRLDRPTDRPHCYHIQTLTCPSGTHAKRRL